MHDIVRWNERALEKALRTRRVVVISVARQCGKSTLLEMYFKGKAEVRSLDSKQLRDAAILDPQSFIRNDTDCPMVIDEIQKAPDLLSEIKLVVDKNRAPGQYVVTGSSTPARSPSSFSTMKSARMTSSTSSGSGTTWTRDGSSRASLPRS